MVLFSSRLLQNALPASLLLILPANGAAAQTRANKCHVYVVDVAETKRAFERISSSDDEKALAKTMSAGQTIFPEFRPTIGEEGLTTKHYSFPGSKLVITAIVFYTDESMASHGETASASRNDSMLIA